MPGCHPANPTSLLINAMRDFTSSFREMSRGIDELFPPVSQPPWPTVIDLAARV
jgi:hypothetical protein